MSTEETTLPQYDYVSDGEHFRTLHPDEYAEHIEQSRAFRAEHGYPPGRPPEGHTSIRWLGPYDKCERCGVPVVGAEMHYDDGRIERQMREVQRLRTRVDPWVPGERIGVAQSVKHRCAR